MTKHSPLIRLQAAREAQSRAAEACMHWDFDGIAGEHECCYALAEANVELSRARKALRNESCVTEV